MKSKQWYVKQLKRKPVQTARYAVQAIFLLFILFVGLRFYQFYEHFASNGETAYVPRPSAVEGFLPISALVSLKVWLSSGYFDKIHPAGLVLFTFFVASGLILRKAFCGWLCPIGTVSDWLGILGKKIFRRNFEIAGWLAWVLTPLKYLLLFFFFKIVVMDMPTYDARLFLEDPYNKISDVKMLLFFLHVSRFVLIVLIVLALLSVLYKNFWCRFLCPYGALIGLGSIFGITKIKRNEKTCTNCQACTKVCPQRIKVSEKTAVRTPNCTACMACVEACPVKDTLNMTVVNKKVNKWVIPLSFLVLFFVVVGIAKMTGHWNTIITYNDWKQLIPQANNIGH